MSNLYIEEYVTSAMGARGGVPAAQQPPIAVQKVDFSGGVAASAPFNPVTGFVRIAADAACSYSFGTNPTATVDNAQLNANQVEYFGVTAGDKVSVIANGGVAAAAPTELWLQRDFHAVGDDTHDDTANVVAWLAAATSDRGVVMRIENGIYKLTDQIVNLKTGLVFEAPASTFGSGPSNDSANMGAIFRQHTAAKACWIQGSATGVNQFRGCVFRNIGFADATGAGTSGLVLYSGFNSVESCSAQLFLTGNGFRTAIPSGGDSAPLNRFSYCKTNDCLHGFRDQAGYVTFEGCITQKFSLGGGGVPHTGTGIWVSADQTTIMFGHQESSDVGILNDSSQGVRVGFTTFEDNNTLDVWMNKASGSSGTRALLCITTSKVAFGPHQNGDVLVGGDFNTVTDAGDTTIIVGHEVIKIGARSL